MLSRNRLLIHAAAGLGRVLPPSVAPAEDGDWLLRAGVHQINPDKNNLPDVLGGNVVLDKDETFTLDAEYMLTRAHRRRSLRSLCTSRTTCSSRTRALVTPQNIGETDLFAPILGLNWHFNVDGAIRPYLGVGVNWSDFSGEERVWPGGSGELTARNRPGVRVSPVALASTSAPASTGSSTWMCATSISSTDVEARVPAGLGFTTVPLGEANIDPWIYGIAIGYRFGAEKPLPEPVAEEPPPPPPPPPPPEKCADGDNDGVCDADDKCPGTPRRHAASISVGCPLSQTLKLLFDFDSAELRPESITELERLVKFMNDVPFATALIEGHTDSVGADAYNLALSDRRAKSVFDYLTSRGVDPARLKSVGKGESEPVADNATDEGRQENRRVLLIRTDTGT